MSKIFSYLQEALSSKINSAESRQVYSNAASIAYGFNTVFYENYQTAPYDGICIMTSKTINAGYYSTFMYVNSNSVEAGVINGIRSYAQANEMTIMQVPVKKGNIIFGDFVNAEFQSFYFTKTTGS